MVRIQQNNFGSCVIVIFIVIGYVCGAPDLQPGTQYFCPNEIGTYTCHDQQIIALDWTAEPYIPANDPIKFTSSFAPLDLNSPPQSRADHFYASLINFTNYNITEEIGDLTTSLMVITGGLENGTNITCRTSTIRNMIFSMSTSTSTLYFAGQNQA